jgi:hypothetical protein
LPWYAEWREPPSDCLCDNTFLSLRVIYSSERTSTRRILFLLQQFVW